MIAKMEVWLEKLEANPGKLEVKTEASQEKIEAIAEYYDQAHA
jgi:hypothetical protein